MSTDSHVKLIDGPLKDIENRIVLFYEEIGKMMRLNDKAVKIFTYLQIYGKLTQEQLKQLTNQSSSTISTTLQAFIQSGVVRKELIANSRQKAYHIMNDRVSFVYIPFTNIMTSHEMIDDKLVSIVAMMEKQKTKYPVVYEFLKRRINSLRNYIEAQRRAINGKLKYDFFSEATSQLIMKIDSKNIPQEFHDYEKDVIELIILHGLFYGTDIIKNTIMGYFVTRGKIDQETLEKLTGFSRSTISRNVQQMLDDGRFVPTKREFRKSQDYFLESASLSICNNILNADDRIFSWIESFEELILDLQTKPDLIKDKKMNQFLLRRIKVLLQEIDDFKVGSLLLENARNELQSFIKRN